MDLDADAKLNLKEFSDAIRPVEKFTTKQACKPMAGSKAKLTRPKSSLIKEREYVSTRKSRAVKTFNHLS